MLSAVYLIVRSSLCLFLIFNFSVIITSGKFQLIWTTDETETEIFAELSVTKTKPCFAPETVTSKQCDL